MLFTRATVSHRTDRGGYKLVLGHPRNQIGEPVVPSIYLCKVVTGMMHRKMRLGELNITADENIGFAAHVL